MEKKHKTQKQSNIKKSRIIYPKEDKSSSSDEDIKKFNIHK